MRVLIINAILYTAETDIIPKAATIKDTMIYTLCMGFVKNGDEPVLIAAKDYKPVEEEVYPFKIVWMESKWKKVCKPRCLPFLRGLGQFIKKNKEKYDYIISSEVFSLLSLCSALYAKEKTIIWHELGAHNNLMKKIPSKIWYNTIPKIFMSKIQVVPRSVQAKQFISRYCKNVSNIIIDHGVDIDKIGFSTDKENFFVVISQLIERKRIGGIIDKFNQFIKEDDTSYTLKIIGDGTEKELLRHKVKTLGIEHNIVFLGKCTHTEISPILMKARALLVNTVKDNSMVSIVESIAAGTPVITTEVPFNAFYIKKEQLGIVDNEWGTPELKEICLNNSRYVHNCILYREKLSSKYCAEQFGEVSASLLH